MESYKAKFEKALYEKNAFTDALATVEEKTGVKRTYMVAGVVAALALWLVFGYAGAFISTFLGFVYPAYQSVKAIESSRKDDDTQWLTYWTVFGAFSIVEFFTDIFLSWFPFYYLVKMIFLAWCMAPVKNNGSEFIYQKFLKPFVLKHEKEFEEGISKVTDLASSTLNEGEGSCLRYRKSHTVNNVTIIHSQECKDAAELVEESESEEMTSNESSLKESSASSKESYDVTVCTSDDNSSPEEIEESDTSSTLKESVTIIDGVHISDIKEEPPPAHSKLVTDHSDRDRMGFVAVQTVENVHFEQTLRDSRGESEVKAAVCHADTIGGTQEFPNLGTTGLTDKTGCRDGDSSELFKSFERIFPKHETISKIENSPIHSKFVTEDNCKNWAGDENVECEEIMNDIREVSEVEDEVCHPDVISGSQKSVNTGTDVLLDKCKEEHSSKQHKNFELMFSKDEMVSDMEPPVHCTLVSEDNVSGVVRVEDVQCEMLRDIWEVGEIKDEVGYLDIAGGSKESANVGTGEFEDKIECKEEEAIGQQRSFELRFAKEEMVNKIPVTSKLVTKDIVRNGVGIEDAHCEEMYVGGVSEDGDEEVCHSGAIEGSQKSANDGNDEFVEENEHKEEDLSELHERFELMLPRDDTVSGETCLMKESHNRHFVADKDSKNGKGEMGFTGIEAGHFNKKDVKNDESEEMTAVENIALHNDDKLSDKMIINWRLHDDQGITQDMYSTELCMGLSSEQGDIKVFGVPSGNDDMIMSGFSNLHQTFEEIVDSNKAIEEVPKLEENPLSLCAGELQLNKDKYMSIESDKPLCKHYHIDREDISVEQVDDNLKEALQHQVMNSDESSMDLTSESDSPPSPHLESSLEDLLEGVVSGKKERHAEGCTYFDLIELHQDSQEKDTSYYMIGEGDDDHEVHSGEGDASSECSAFSSLGENQKGIDEPSFGFERDLAKMVDYSSQSDNEMEEQLGGTDGRSLIDSHSLEFETDLSRLVVRDNSDSQRVALVRETCLQEKVKEAIGSTNDCRSEPFRSEVELTKTQRDIYPDTSMETVISMCEHACDGQNHGENLRRVHSTPHVMYDKGSKQQSSIHEERQKRIEKRMNTKSGDILEHFVEETPALNGAEKNVVIVTSKANYNSFDCDNVTNASKQKLHASENRIPADDHVRVWIPLSDCVKAEGSFTKVSRNEENECTSAVSPPHRNNNPAKLTPLDAKCFTSEVPQIQVHYEERLDCYDGLEGEEKEIWVPKMDVASISSLNVTNLDLQLHAVSDLLEKEHNLSGSSSLVVEVSSERMNSSVQSSPSNNDLFEVETDKVQPQTGPQVYESHEDKNDSEVKFERSVRQKDVDSLLAKIVLKDEECVLLEMTEPATALVHTGGEAKEFEESDIDPLSVGFETSMFDAGLTSVIGKSHQFEESKSRYHMNLPDLDSQQAGPKEETSRQKMEGVSKRNAMNRSSNPHSSVSVVNVADNSSVGISDCHEPDDGNNNWRKESYSGFENSEFIDKNPLKSHNVSQTIGKDTISSENDKIISQDDIDMLPVTFERFLDSVSCDEMDISLPSVPLHCNKDWEEMKEKPNLSMEGNLSKMEQRLVPVNSIIETEVNGSDMYTLLQDIEPNRFCLAENEPLEKAECHKVTTVTEETLRIKEELKREKNSLLSVLSLEKAMTSLTTLDEEIVISGKPYAGIGTDL